MTMAATYSVASTTSSQRFLRKTLWRCMRPLSSTGVRDKCLHQAPPLCGHKLYRSTSGQFVVARRRSRGLTGRGLPLSHLRRAAALQPPLHGHAESAAADEASRPAVCRRKSPGRDSSPARRDQNDSLAEECTDVTLSSATDPWSIAGIGRCSNSDYQALRVLLGRRVS
jgi:hypothetical protein